MVDSVLRLKEYGTKNGSMVDEKLVKEYFSSDQVVDHYSRGTLKVGLWESEKMLFTRYFEKNDRILDMGTGTGRIAFGLCELGYRYVMGVELCKTMVQRARKIARMYNYSVVFQVGNATALKFEDNLFDQAIFGFNGLMQIPGRDNRIKALREIRRVIQPGGRFIFTAHDRDHIRWKKFWKQQRKSWNSGAHNPDLIDFGDRLEDTEMGKLYIHVTTTEEMRADLNEAGWIVEMDSFRSQLANESLLVREFSDECRFWVVRKPEAEAHSSEPSAP